MICRGAHCAPVSERINCGRTLFAPTIVSTNVKENEYGRYDVGRKIFKAG